MPTKVCKPQAAADFLQVKTGTKMVLHWVNGCFGVFVKYIAICDSFSVHHIYLVC